MKKCDFQEPEDCVVYAVVQVGDVNGGLKGQLKGQLNGQLNDSQKETFEFTPEGTQTNHHYIYKAISPPGWWPCCFLLKTFLSDSIAQLTYIIYVCKN